MKLYQASLVLNPMLNILAKLVFLLPWSYVKEYILN